jgi:hypothetical protein
MYVRFYSLWIVSYGGSICQIHTAKTLQTRKEVMQSISAGVAQVLAASSPESLACVAGSPNAIANALLSPLFTQDNRRAAAEETPRGTR